MTTLYQQITEDRKAARKAADSFKVTTLGTLLGEIQGQWSSLKVDERGEEPSDLLVGKIVINFVNNLKEFLKVKDTVEGQTELSILQTYLPQPLTEGQLKIIVENHLQEYSEDKGNKIKFVMDFLKEKYPNLYDGKTVRQFIT